MALLPMLPDIRLESEYKILLTQISMLLLEGGDSIKKLKMWTIQFLPSIKANRRKLKFTVPLPVSFRD